MDTTGKLATGQGGDEAGQAVTVWERMAGRAYRAGQAVTVDVLPGAPGALDALCRELGPEVAPVVDAGGRVLGLVRWGLRGVEAVDV